MCVLRMWVVAWLLATDETNESDKEPRSPTWHSTANAAAQSKQAFMCA
jgi:hypothetical protein